MRLVIAVAALALAPLLQAGVLYHAAPGGVTIDLIFLVSLIAGLVGGPIAGVVCGGIGGLLMGSALGDLGLPLAAVYGFVGGCAALAAAHPVAWAAPMAASLTAAMLTLETVVLAPFGAPHPAMAAAFALAGWHALLALPLTAATCRLAAPAHR